MLTVKIGGTNAVITATGERFEAQQVSHLSTFKFDVGPIWPFIKHSYRMAGCFCYLDESGKTAIVRPAGEVGSGGRGGGATLTAKSAEDLLCQLIRFDARVQDVDDKLTEVLGNQEDTIKHVFENFEWQSSTSISE